MTDTDLLTERPDWLTDGDPGQYLTEPTLGFTAYGVTLAMMGEDGDWVALGHVEPLRMLAAMRKAGRVHIGLTAEEIFGDWSDFPDFRLVDTVTHARAVFTTGPYERHVEGDWWCYLNAEAAASERAVDVTLWRI